MPSPANLRRDEPLTALQPKRHEVLGLLSFATAILLGLALAGFDVRGGPDWAGPYGARAAETMVAFLGSAAALVPLSLFILSIRLFRRTLRPFRFFYSVGTMAIIATVATALHLWFGERPALGGLAAGGLLGSTVGEALKATLGEAGANTVIITALLVALVMRTRLSIVSVASGAHAAGRRGGSLLRNGAGTVARAWRQAREAEQRARASLPSDEPRIVAVEEEVERALAPLLGQDDDDGLDDAHAARPVRGARPQRDLRDDALTRALVTADEAPAPAARQARKRRGAPDLAPEAPAEPEAPRVTASPWMAALERAEAPEVEATAPVTSAPVTSAPTPRRPAPVAARRAPVQEPVPAPMPTAVFEHSPDDLDDDSPPARPEAIEAPRSLERVSPLRARPSERPGPAADELPPSDEDPNAPLTIVSHERAIEKAMKRAAGPVDEAATAPAARQRDLEMPTVELLSPPPTTRVGFDPQQLKDTAERLVKSLADYDIEGKVMEVHPGPVVTTYEVVPAAGTKLSKIARLSDDVAMSLEASRVRIVAPIPGKGRVGFEIPNATRQTVYLRELIETEAFRNLGGALPVVLGKDVVGAPFFADLATMPHLIVAGATGAGKSVGLNVMLASLLYKRTPEEVRFLMIDPKVVELAVYDGIPHMLLPVVTDMKKATLALRWVVDEMERRYQLFSQVGVKSITTFNEKVNKAIAEGKPVRGLDGPVRTKENGTTVAVAESDEGAPPIKPVKLPYILAVVDEFADLIMVAGKDVEAAIARLAQKARAAGIHVILATQRPSVDVITGMIKANFPARIAFKVSQRVDSRTILDQQGAEHLLGRGDMLILPPGSSDLRRVHCAFVSEEEVNALTDHWRQQDTPTYDDDILKPREEEGAAEEEPSEIKVPQEKYERARNLVITSKKCSVSYVQRHLGIGYNVAARIVDKLEREGIVGAPKGPGKDREVLG